MASVTAHIGAPGPVVMRRRKQVQLMPAHGSAAGSLVCGSGPRLECLSLRNCGLTASGARVLAAWLLSESASAYTRLPSIRILLGPGARAVALALDRRGAGLPAGWRMAVDDATGRPLPPASRGRRSLQHDGGGGVPPVGAAAAAAAAASGGRRHGDVVFVDIDSPPRTFGCHTRAATRAQPQLPGSTTRHSPASSARSPPRPHRPASLRLGGNAINALSVAAIAQLIKRGGLVSSTSKVVTSCVGVWQMARPAGGCARGRGTAAAAQPVVPGWRAARQGVAWRRRRHEGRDPGGWAESRTRARECRGLRDDDEDPVQLMTHLALHSRRVLYFRYTVQCTVRKLFYESLC